MTVNSSHAHSCRKNMSPSRNGLFQSIGGKSMVIKASNMEKQVRSELKGGNGNIHFLNCVNKDTIPNCRLLAFMTIPPSCSIGEHEHVKETECYIIRSGEGVIIDNGEECQVTAGDVVLTRNVDKHSVLNKGNEPLEILAFIVMN